MPPVKGEVLTKAVVKPLVTPAAWGGLQRAWFIGSGLTPRMVK